MDRFLPVQKGNDLSMKIINRHGDANRSPIQLGASILLSCIVIMLILLATHNQMDSAVTKNNRGEVETVCTTSSIVTTEIRSTASSTTTSAEKTTRTTTTTVQITSMIATATESQTIVVVTDPSAFEPQPEPIAPVQEYVEPQPPIQDEAVCTYSDSDAILLAQLINKEASANWDGKIAVANCVVNRANINGISIYDVIFQNGQFTTCWSLGYYSDTDYQAAVQVLTYGSTDTRIYFFDGNHGGLNWFYDQSHGYLYAA